MEKSRREKKIKTTAPVAMDDGVESQAVFPRGGEILDADTRVLGRSALGPSQKSFAGRQWFILTHHDIRYLKRKQIIKFNLKKYKKENKKQNEIKGENNKHVVNIFSGKLFEQ